ncbi:MAG TPA: AAA family ATPase [Chloroflexia bacterium]|nr:AAA family ATPase [Chloroflexia bacterium]
MLLLAGSSGTGKTMAAQALGRRLGVSVLQVDDLRLALQQVTTPEQHPSLHWFLTDTSAQWGPPEQTRAGLIAVTAALEPALAIITSHHCAVRGAGPIILEGDGISPALGNGAYLASLPQFDRVHLARGVVRGVVLMEESDSRLLHNMRARGRDHGAADRAAEEAFAHASLLYGRWLAEQAAAHAVPVLPAQPWGSLVERILTCLDEDAAPGG